VDGQPLRRHRPQTARLEPGDRLGGVAVCPAAARLDLAKHDDVTVEGDDVDLAGRDPPITRDHPHAAGDQMVRGEFLSPFAEPPASLRHAHTVAHPQACDQRDNGPPVDNGTPGDSGLSEPVDLLWRTP
jgi:hypothetical protein